MRKNPYWSDSIDRMQSAAIDGEDFALPEFSEPRIYSRRTFMKLTGLAASGLVLGFGRIDAANSATSEANPFPLAYIQISRDGKIILYAKDPEIGQGIKTALPMIIAEELDADWQSVEVVQAPTNKTLYGRQSAGGSRSVRRNWNELRHVGALARTMLTQVAANNWQVDINECTTHKSVVTHSLSGRQFTYAELAEDAAKLSLPEKSSIKLKSTSQYQLLGSRKSGVDNLQLVTGKPMFGIDQKIPGMLYAVYEKCPARGGRVKNANLEDIRTLPGVTDVIVMPGRDNPFGPLPGVVIVAKSTWQALAAKRKLSVQWDETDAAKDSWSSAVAQAQKLAHTPGKQTIVERGNVDKPFSEDTRVDAFYHYAFVAHAQMEPENCTAWFKGDSIELWVPTQTPQWGRETVAELLSLDTAKVFVNQVRAGGAFGRRLFNDYMLEAAAISKRIAAPVQLVWTREDSMNQDYPRLGGFHQLSGSVNKDGKLSAWQNHFITFTHDGKKPPRAGGLKKEEFPHPMINNLKLTQTMLPWDTPSGLWRAPSSNVLAFVIQSFIHELAVAAKRDHLDFLLELLGQPRWLEPGNPEVLHTGRAINVIKEVTEKAGWGKPLPKGHGLGLAFHFSHAGHVAEVAHVSVTEDKVLTVHQVTVVADVGPVINLSGAENQCEGSVVDGLSTMLGLKATFEAGRIAQTNFHQYPILRLPHTPEIDVHFIDSDYPPSGLGEPALPPLAPAVGNAIFAATGERVRTLPISKEGFRV